MEAYQAESCRACAQEYVQNCNLSLSVHATDFDDNFAGERVANFLANGRAMGGDCYPLVNGCVSKASRELLYSCISDLPVDTVISSKGNLRVDAEIPGNVDECPYNGNLLHGVSTIQCHVGKLADLTTTTTTTTTSSSTTSNWFVSQARASGAAGATSLEDLDFVKRWLAEHPGKSVEDMPGYDSFYKYNTSQSAEPKSLGVVAYYGSPTGHVETQLGSAATARSASAASGASSGARPYFPFHRPTSLATQGHLRCAEKGCSTSLAFWLQRRKRFATYVGIASKRAWLICKEKYAQIMRETPIHAQESPIGRQDIFVRIQIVPIQVLNFNRTLVQINRPAV